MNRIDIDGEPIAHLDLGDARGADPIVLLHGYPQNHSTWRKQIVALARDYRVIAPDWFGWGASEQASPSEYERDVDRLEKFLDALSIDRCNLFAHDYGGYLALGMFARDSERIGRLAILNSRSHATFSGWFYAVVVLTRALTRTALGRAAFRWLPLAAMHRGGMLRDRDAGCFDDAQLDAYTAWLSTPGGSDFLAELFRQYEVSARRDLLEAVRGDETPTSIIWGTHDPYLSTLIAHELAHALPNSELTLLDDCGHFVMEESPDEVTAALRRLLGRSIGVGECEDRVAVRRIGRAVEQAC